LEGNQVFAGLEGVENLLLGGKLLGAVVGGLDRKTDAPVALVDLDGASWN